MGVSSSSYSNMGLACLLFFLPAVALSSKNSASIVPAEDLKVCEYFDARIVRLGEIVNEELRTDVDVGSDLYITLEESKLCDTVGYVAIPECVANNEGDECVARKTSELIRKSLSAAIKAEKIKQLPSGEKFFATCKHIGYKNVLKTFKSARSLMSAECGLPGNGGSRSRRNADLLPALLLAGSYDPSSIWFQYFLCKDIDLYCYFFTQGWTQGQYGQYYLYDNLLDDNTGLFAGATDTNLGTIALLGGLGGGLGGGYGQPSGYYPTYGAHPAPAPTQGRKRRGSEYDECLEDESRCPRGWSDGATNQGRKCRSNDVDCEVYPNDPACRECCDSEYEVCLEDEPRCPRGWSFGSPKSGRKRRSNNVDCKATPNDPACIKRNRREECEAADDECNNRERRSTKACDVCKLNSDSLECKNCKE